MQSLVFKATHLHYSIHNLSNFVQYKIQSKFTDRRH